MNIISARFFLYFVFCWLLISSCSEQQNSRFVKLPSSQTNIDFSNDVESTPEFNIQNYLYFYDGGGVSSGDINNDGLPDLFFAGNNVPNRLYLNKGNFEFEDITESAGILHVPGSWSTGVTMVDINGDNLLDMYVSKVNYLTKEGPNQLYINNGDLTFSERAADYNLDFEGYSTQAAFFDYDIDGDLDLFLLNHSFHSENTYGQAEELRRQTHPQAGDKFFRNDGDSFIDVTDEAGIYSSALGYGLGVAVTDINRDGFLDIYVGNDFHEDDYFYINNGDGTFTESLYQMMGHTSNSSMGNDAGDINNDGLTDLISLDMMPGDHDVMMRSGGPDLVMISETKKRFGFGSKNNRNTLQVNRGLANDGLPKFSETAIASGVAATEWSWASLLADFNNDGFQDLYITNGLPKRPNELDYVAALQRVREQYSGEEQEERAYSLIERMSSVYVSNYMFKNNEGLIFDDVTEDWGFATPSYSNGAVYTDLNNDGKLDIVVNNINNEAFLYQNNYSEADSLHYLKVKLHGEGGNTSGIGSKIIAYSNGEMMAREQMPTRGFQSSVDHTIHFGLASKTTVDSILVIWPNKQFHKLTDVEVNQTIDIRQTDAEGEFDYNAFNQTSAQKFFADVSAEAGIDHRHEENMFDDFSREPLIPYKLSTQGPALAVGDVNSDGLDDYYLGGSKGFSGKLFIQNSDGSFNDVQNNDFQEDRASEDVDAIFFDATGDSLNDLYIVSGGNEYSGQSPNLHDRLYINTGNGVFEKSLNSIPQFSVNGSNAEAADFDGDGHTDLFVGGHTVPWRYGIGPQSILLKNNGRGVFNDVTSDAAPGLELIGNVTSAAWIQQPQKEFPDLLVAGEWMGIHYFENKAGKLIKKTDDYALGNLKGLWQSMKIADLDGNEYPDIILGNFGTNSRLQASDESPLKLYVNDFNGNGQAAPVIAQHINGEEKPFEQLDEISAQIPEVQEKIQSYHDYANKSLEELLTSAKLDSALQKEITELRSVVLLNIGSGAFEIKPLPFEAQLFPVKAIHTGDFNSDGFTDIALGGNVYDVKPSMGGKQDAGLGLILIGKGNGEFDPKHFRETGFLLEGEIRSIQSININNQVPHVIVARNNQSPLIFRIHLMKN